MTLDFTLIVKIEILYYVYLCKYIYIQIADDMLKGDEDDVKASCPSCFK